MIPDTDVNPYGANFFLQLEAEPWKVDRTLQLASEAGLGWVKQHFPWEEIELRKGKFWDDRLNKSTWDKYDRIVDTSRRNGLEIIARLDRPPPWTRADNSVPEAPPDNFDDYGDFLAEFAERYRGRIRYYQIWNEPNIYPEWGDRPVDAAAYTRLLKIAYTRIKRVDPSARILSAPLAQTLEETARNRSELTYLEAMYDAGAQASFDILFANGYGFERPPDDPPDRNVLNFQRVALVREIMERHGDAAKPIWFNEFGWNAAPETFPPEKLIWRRVSETQQAEWVVQAIKQARAKWEWAGVFCIWYFRQAGQIQPDQADYYFRMVDVGFTPRPLYNAVKRATAGTTIAGPGIYQESHPAITYQGDWAIIGGSDFSGGDARRAHDPGDSATITFRGTEISLLTRRGPDDGVVYVTLDGHEANRLPRDRQGRSFADLYGALTQSNVLLTIADGLDDRDHVVRITVGTAGVPATRDAGAVIDGIIVQRIAGDGDRDRIRDTAPWIIGLIVVAAGYGLVAWRRAR